MAHSGKTMTFAADLLPHEDGIYNLGDADQKWNIFGDVNGTKITLGTASSAGSIVVYDGSNHYGTIKTTNLGSNRTYTLPNANGTIALTSHNHDTIYSAIHQTSWNWAENGTEPLSKYVTFDANITTDNAEKAPDAGWYNGFVSSHGNYLASFILNKHRTANWYVGYEQYPKTNSTYTEPTWYLLAHSGNVDTGDNSGEIKIAGINVKVKDIGGAAYKAEDYYATKTEVNGLLAAANALIYKGIREGADTSSSNAYGALTPAANCGDTYKVSKAGFINGLRVEIGDMLICTTDNTAAATSANYTTVRNNWNIIQTSEGSVSTAVTSSSDNMFAVFHEASGRIIKTATHISAYPANDNITVQNATKYRNGLRIYGQAYGNTATDLTSNTKGVIRYEDGGPRIEFSASETNGSDNGAIIFTNHDSANTGGGSSFHFVGQAGSNNTGGNLAVTAPDFVARRRLMVGKNFTDASYTAYINGATYINGVTTLTNQLKFTDVTAIKHIEFTRQKSNGGPSYVCYPESGELAIGYATGYDNSLAVFDGNTALRPGKSNTFDLGTSSYKWANVYATTFTGNLSGNAATATSSKVLANQNGTYGTATSVSNRVTNTNIAHVNNGGVTHFKVGTATNGPAGGGNILHFYWDTSDAWDAQLHIPNNSANSMSWRGSSTAGTWDSWRTILDSANYSSYGTYSTNLISSADLTNTIGTINTRWGGVHSGYLQLSGPASDPSSSTGARIIFSYDSSTTAHNAQPVVLAYSPNDSYRAPYGLKLFGTDGNGAGAWFETTGDIIGGRNLSLAGEATLTKANNGANFGIYVNHTNPNSDTSKAKKVALMVGGSSGSGGVYDATIGKWIVYSDTDGDVTLNGNALTATNVAWSGITDNPISFITPAYGSTGWKQLGGRVSSQKSIIISKPTDAVTWGTIAHSAAITFGCGDTKGMLDISYNSPLISIAGGSNSQSTDAAPKWYFKLSGTSGQTYTFPSTSKTLAATDGSNASGKWSINTSGKADTAGAADTATTLAASKTIWGQSFDGSANVTGNLIDVGSQIKAQSGVSLLSFLTSAGGALQAKFGRLGLNSSYSNADLTNYVLDVGGVSRFTGQMNITYAPTGTNSTGKGLLNLTSSAAATVVKSGTYSWGINHLVTNLASGGNTCLMTGASNGTNNQAVLEFHYHGSNNAENAVGLGLYGNNGLLTINKAGTVKIKATTASTSTTTGALVVGGGIATGAASFLTGSVHIVGSAGGDALVVRGISGCDATGIRGENVDTTDQGLFLNINGGPVLFGYADATAGNYVHVQYNQDASSTATGAFRVSGGVGISKKLYVGTSIDAPKFTATHTAGGQAEFKVQYSTTISYWWGVGTGNENHGLYDDKAGTGKWILSAAADNKWTFEGSVTGHASLDLPLTGGTLTGAVNFANNTWNKVGDDVQIGDINKAGHLGIQGVNGNTGIFFTTYNQTTKTTGASLSWNGTDLISDKSVQVPDITIFHNANQNVTLQYNSTDDSLDFIFA